MFDEKLILTAGCHCYDNNKRKISNTVSDVDSYDLDKNRNVFNNFKAGFPFGRLVGQI